MTTPHTNITNGASVHAAAMALCETPCTTKCNCRSHPECAGEIKRLMNDHHQRQLSLCSELESIADGLPDHADTQHMLVVSRSLYSTVKAAHDFEEKRVFPFLQAMGLEDEAMAQSLERLRFEHWEDESFAEELSDGLRRQVMQGDEHSSETLSYMLRGFFEGIRRHIAFEVEHVLPIMMNSQKASQ
ncbi:hemerythrin domain-containing protein [Pseudahrensia aquimaris]|uniref:Hemerythrin domain-containing protein n=1 Tax=Pseudahrensia aquimaris TaxID=744461 RepID=A0ABW3FHB4_9HYPH